MAKYRKRPVVIDAWQWHGEPVLGYDTTIREGGTLTDADGVHPYLVVQTPEGAMFARVGDWIIRGIAGEYYPCKPDIFAATYEPVEEG